MKFMYLAATLFFGLVLVSSCKKDDNGSTFQFDKYPRIKSIQYGVDSSSSIDYYEYDSKGRLNKLNQYGSILKIEYSDTKVAWISQDSKDTMLYKLNSKGLAISVTDYLYYEYDENGYLIHWYIDVTNAGFISILNGNMSSGKRIYSDDTTFYIYEFSQKNNTIGNENKGMSFLGKQNINLTSKQISLKNSEPPDTVYYSYEFDIKGRVVKQIENQAGKTHITMYTYY